MKPKTEQILDNIMRSAVPGERTKSFIRAISILYNNGLDREAIEHYLRPYGEKVGYGQDRLDSLVSDIFKKYIN